MIGHVAYVATCIVVWLWGISQLRYAVRSGLGWPPSWSLTAAVWLLTKALFFTYIGWQAWGALDDPPHVYVVLAIAAVHVWAFWQWLRLPDGEVVTPEPPVHRAPPRERKIYWFH